MQVSFAKIKRIGLYFFAIVGIIAVLWFVLQVFFLPVYRYGTGGGGPLYLESPARSGLSEVFLGEKWGISEETGEMPQETTEGVLTQRKIIKDGSLQLLVKKAEETAAAIQDIAKRLEGFVSYSYIWEVSEGVKSGTVTIRVPADHFEEAMEEIKKLAIKVERETTNTKDVTEEFVDLEARLKNLRAEEEQYLEIMKEAETVEDALAVAGRLSDVRGRIERIEGQLQYLSRQIEMSTITVSLTSEAEVEVLGIRWRPLFVVKQSLKSTLRGLTGYVDAMVRFIFALPVIALWLATIALFAVLGWRLFSWLRKRFFSKKKK